MALSIEPRDKRIKPPRILLYGTQGIGKSTFGALAPKPIFIQTEDGLASIDVEAYPLATSFKDVLNYIKELATNEHNYKTVIVDSVDWLERLIFDQVCEERGAKTIGDIAYGAGYAQAANLWQQYIDCLNFLRDNKDMMVIQIAHSHIKRYENPETDAYDRYQIKMHEKASALLLEHSDIVLFANHVVGVKKEQEGFSKRTRAIGSGDRVLYTEERPAFIAKNRYSLPPEIAFDKEGSYWSVIASHIPYFNRKGE